MRCVRREGLQEESLWQNNMQITLAKDLKNRYCCYCPPVVDFILFYYRTWYVHARTQEKHSISLIEICWSAITYTLCNGRVNMRTESVRWCVCVGVANIGVLRTKQMRLYVCAYRVVFLFLYLFFFFIFFFFIQKYVYFDNCSQMKAWSAFSMKFNSIVSGSAKK